MRATKRRSLAFVLLIAFVASVLSVDGTEAGAGTESPGRPGLIQQRDPGPSHPYLDRTLADISERTRRGTAIERLAAASEVATVTVQVSQGLGDEVAARLRSLGATEVTHHGDVVFATVTGGLLDDVVAVNGVRLVQGPLEPVALDLVTGEGVAYIDADDWHADGYTGQGVKVAIIDLGFHGYASLLGTELPASVTTNHWGCDGIENNGERHGTAVAEIVHEVAPDAQLYLLCIDKPNDLSLAVAYAIAQGVRVINHSVGWPNSGRGDGSGVIGNIVETAHQSGILWVNAAGNSAQQHWGGAFTDGNADTIHEFSGSDTTITFNIPGGTPSDPAFVSVYVRWDDWEPTATIDLDLCLVNSSGAALFCSENRQIGGNWTPVESLKLMNTGGQVNNVGVRIHKFAGSGTPEIDVYLLGTATPIEHNVSARSITDPATAPFVVAVGAVSPSSGLIHSYSSRGPTIDGRTKPDLVGPAGVYSASYAPNLFFGTSASSPHVAGATALLLNACPLLTYDGLTDRLLALTEPAGDANTYGAGWLKLGDPTATTTQEWCADQSDDPPPEDPVPDEDPIVHPFTDIIGHEYEEAIAWLWDRGITVGCSATKYCPDRLLTRAEMATFVRRVADLAPSGDNGLFTDHLKSVHRTNINAIRIAGITVGCSQTKYCPSRTLTRAEIATLVAKAAQVPLAATTHFTDLAGHWSQQRVEGMHEAGIAWSCDGETLFCPNQRVDRAEMAQWIHLTWLNGYLPQYDAP